MDIKHANALLDHQRDNAASLQKIIEITDKNGFFDWQALISDYIKNQEFYYQNCTELCKFWTF